MSTFQAIALLVGLLLGAYPVGQFFGVFEAARLKVVNTKIWALLLPLLDEQLNLR